MMTDTLQNRFKNSYTKHLKDGALAGDTISQYESGVFDLDESQFRRIAQVFTPTSGLQRRMIDALNKYGKHCAEAAIALYEAYQSITPLVASSESFWAYLCHTELNEFVRMEWPWDRAKNPQNFILEHYFFGKGYKRNALASLWWGVHQTYDDDRKQRGEDPYALTRIFFKNYSFRTTWIAVLFRIKNALNGILEYLYSHPEVTSLAMENRMRFICKYFNMLGACKQLSSLPKSFFVEELEQLHKVILSIHGRNDVQNKATAAIIQASDDDSDDE